MYRKKLAEPQRLHSDSFAAYIAIACAILLFFSRAAYSGQYDLLVTISTDRSGGVPDGDYYLIGEPVFLKVNFSSFVPEPLIFQFTPNLQSDLDVLVETPTTLPKKILAAFPSASPRSSGEEIFAFETLDYTVKLLYDRADKPLLRMYDQEEFHIISWPNLVFDHESEFNVYAEVQAVINNLRQVYFTDINPVRIWFKAPEPNSPEDLILGKLTTNKAYITAMHKGYAPPEHLFFFEKALAEFPRNRFTPHFLYVLANSYTRSSQEEIDKKMDCYERLIAEYPNFPPILQVMQEYGLLCHTIGKSDKAFEIAQQLFHEAPMLVRRHKEDTLMSTYVVGSRLEYDPLFWMLAP